MPEPGIPRPSLDLVNRWADSLEHRSDADVFYDIMQYGADLELVACTRALANNHHFNLGEWLHAQRRPLVPLKQRALEDLESAERLYPADWSTIRQALEALPND